MIQQPLEIAPVCTRTLQLVRTTCHYFILAHTLGSCNTALSSEGARCSGAEPSNANISFPEHFEGKRQSGEMYLKDCLPLISTFCKFQSLKVKGSQVMFVCLHQHSRSGGIDNVGISQCMCEQLSKQVLTHV